MQQQDIQTVFLKLILKIFQKITNGEIKDINRMRQPKLIDYILLTFLALIWASAFLILKLQLILMDQ